MHPKLEVCTNIPHELSTKAIDLAVYRFTEESGCKEDKIGFINQTLENIASAITNGPPIRYFWLAHEKDYVVAYAMTHVVKDVDNKLTYYMTQAWLHPKYRHSQVAKEYLEVLRNHAKALQCKHIIIPSSRGLKGYLRFLGKTKWHLYCHLLKEDI